MKNSSLKCCSLRELALPPLTHSFRLEVLCAPAATASQLGGSNPINPVRFLLASAAALKNGVVGNPSSWWATSGCLLRITDNESAQLAQYAGSLDDCFQCAQVGRRDGGLEAQGSQGCSRSCDGCGSWRIEEGACNARKGVNQLVGWRPAQPLVQEETIENQLEDAIVCSF